jgi:hypothetical protein
MLQQKFLIPNTGLWSICLILLLAATSSQAQIYKWVDASGQTHYSANKEEADRAKATELNVKSQGPSAEESQDARESWKIKDEAINKRLADQQRLEKARTPVAAPKPQSLSGGRDNGTAEGKCNLARDILSGSVRLRNGNAVDEPTRKVAENDIRYFCK